MLDATAIPRPLHRRDTAAATREDRATRERRLRIGIYDPSRGRDGIWRYVDSLLGRIDLTEFDVSLFCPLDSPHRPEGIRQVPLTNGRVATESNEKSTAVVANKQPHLAQRLWRICAPKAAREYAGFWKECDRLRRLFLRERLDVLHAQVVNYEPAVVAARLAGVPNVVATLHVDTSCSAPRHWIPEILTNHAAHRAIAVSRSTKADWVRRTLLPEGRVTVIHNGVDLAAFSRRHSVEDAKRRFGIEPGTLVIGASGRLVRRKGYQFLLKAAFSLSNQFPGVILAIAGDGPFREELSLLASQLGISDRVRLLGFQPDVLSVLEMLDVYVSSSLQEALPFSVLEAMAVGIPVVATNIPGTAEVVVSNETGLLVPVADEVALAEAIGRMLGDQRMREAMGMAARQRVVRCFNNSDAVAKTLAVYRRERVQIEAD